jgi:hypothetical protein
VKKTLLIAAILAAASSLGGCVAVYDGYRGPHHPPIIYGPAPGVVEIVPVPPPYWHDHYRPYRHHRW